MSIYVYKIVKTKTKKAFLWYITSYDRKLACMAMELEDDITPTTPLYTLRITAAYSLLLFLFSDKIYTLYYCLRCLLYQIIAKSVVRLWLGTFAEYCTPISLLVVVSLWLFKKSLYLKIQAGTRLKIGSLDR